ncbi:RluA family pseudouridine synthase [Flavobacteriales bacterium]|nr:RluA family pseudouridine synthase [Flavobacteriales bacterium]
MINVLYEDNHIIAVNKNPSDIIQGDKTGDKPLGEFVKDYIKKKYDKPGDVFLGVVHRIDRPVSGVILFAKTSKALTRLNKLFQERAVKKTYWAVVKNKPTDESRRLVHYLKKNQQKNKSFAFNREENGALLSELDYKLIKNLDSFYLLEVKPKTGRHHQIRVQLSSIGSPIKGDIKYGSKRTNSDASIHLHARKIEFVHPIKKEKIEIIAPPPSKDSIWKACLNS